MFQGLAFGKLSKKRKFYFSKKEKLLNMVQGQKRIYIVVQIYHVLLFILPQKYTYSPFFLFFPAWIHSWPILHSQAITLLKDDVKVSL